MTEEQWQLEPNKFEALDAWQEFLAWGDVAKWQDLVNDREGVFYRPFLTKAIKAVESGLRRAH